MMKSLVIRVLILLYNNSKWHTEKAVFGSSELRKNNEHGEEEDERDEVEIL